MTRTRTHTHTHTHAHTHTSLRMAVLATTYMYMQFFSGHQIGNKQHQCNPLVKITVFKLHSCTLQATFKINIHYQKYIQQWDRKEEIALNNFGIDVHTHVGLPSNTIIKKCLFMKKEATFLNQQMYNHRCVCACGHDNGKERIHVHACTNTYAQT